MRDYLYIWHDPVRQFIVSSGIEFRDFAATLELSSGVILLTHRFGEASYDKKSRFDYAGKSTFQKLQEENICSWGDFCWADYNHISFPRVPKQEIAELLYFGHKAEPFDEIRIDSIDNRFLYYGHDDGWITKLYYLYWDDIIILIQSLPLSFDKERLLDAMKNGRDGFWITDNSFETEPSTFDIDSVLARRVIQPNV